MLHAQYPHLLQLFFWVPAWTFQQWEEHGWRSQHRWGHVYCQSRTWCFQHQWTVSIPHIGWNLVSCKYTPERQQQIETYAMPAKPMAFFGDLPAKERRHKSNTKSGKKPNSSKPAHKVAWAQNGFPTGKLEKLLKHVTIFCLTASRWPHLDIHLEVALPPSCCICLHYGPPPKWLW